MSKLEITINGRVYSLDCDPEDAPRVREMAVYLDSRVKSLGKTAAMASSDAHLLAITGLMLADEIMELRAQAPGEPALTTAMAGTVEKLAARIESVAKRFEKA